MTPEGPPRGRGRGCGLALAAHLPLQQPPLNAGFILFRDFELSKALTGPDEALKWFRRAAAFVLVPGGPAPCTVRGRASLLAGSCSLASPESLTGACAWALRGWAN